MLRPDFQRILATVSTSTALLLSQPLLAEELEQEPVEENWYQIEVMLIAYSDDRFFSQESWPSQLADLQLPAPTAEDPTQALEADTRTTELTLSEDAIGPSDSELIQAYYQKRHAQKLQQSILTASGLPVEPPESWSEPAVQLATKSMSYQAKRINNQPGMHLVWHKAWLEPVQEKSEQTLHPIQVELSMVDTLNGADIQVQGDIGIYLSRYLHFTSDLIVGHKGELPPNTEQTTAITSADASSPQLPAAKQETSSWVQSATYGQNGTPTVEEVDQAVPEVASQPGYLRIAHIEQSRRMRSNELHYIDHPMLGIVVQTKPVEMEMLEDETALLSQSDDASPLQ